MYFSAVKDLFGGQPHSEMGIHVSGKQVDYCSVRDLMCETEASFTQLHAAASAPVIIAGRRRLVVFQASCKSASHDGVTPVEEHLEALLRLAWRKGGHHTAPCLPLALIYQGQIFISPKHTTTPEKPRTVQNQSEVLAECVSRH